MKLWCERGGVNKLPVPFLGKIENFGMIDMVGMGETDFYPKIVALVSEGANAHIVMPYFKFDSQGKLQPPTTVWRGSVQGIEISSI
jgi:hypothetical protein